MSHENLLAYRQQVQELVQEGKNFRIPNKQRAHAEILIEQIFNSAANTVRLYCGSLDGAFYARPSIEIAIRNYLNKPNTFLYILTEKPIDSSHTVAMALMKSYPNKISIRCRATVDTKTAEHFCVFDEVGYRFEFLHLANGDVEAMANFNEPTTAKKLNILFDDMFVKAVPLSNVCLAQNSKN
jgi:hypothetical protein